MAITYQSAGAVSYTTPIVPGIPASTAAGDLLVLAVGIKPGTAVVNTPKSWVPLGNLASTTGTNGADTGPTRIYLFAKVVDGVETLGSTLSISGTWNTPWAQIYRFSNATGFWDLSFRTGEDTAGGASWSATMSTTMDIASGDLMLAASVDPTDVAHTYSAAAVASTGATYGASTIITQPRSSNGNDIGGFIFTQPVTAGSSSDAPIVTATVSATNTNAYGPTGLLRLREVIEAAQPTNTATVAAAQLDVTHSTDGQARLSSLLTEVANSADGQARLSSLLMEVMTPINKIIYPNGIASGEAFGSPSVTQPGGGQTVTLDGVASAEAFGSPAVTSANTISATAIAGGEAFGSPAVTASSTITATGVGSGEAFGSPTVTTGQTVSTNGIPTAEAFGSPTFTSANTISATAIAGAEAFGTPALTTASTIVATGISSGEAFGSPAVSIDQTVSANGISSAEALGTPALSSASEIQANGIASDESIGTPSIIASVAVALNGIGSAEAFGTLALAQGAQIQPDGIASAEQIGQPALVSAFTVTPDGVASGEAVGSPNLTAIVAIAVTSIGSGEQFGSPTVTIGPGSQAILTLGIGSAQSFGSFSIAVAGITPDEITQIFLDAMPTDDNSCTVILTYRSTEVKKTTIVEPVMIVGPA